ALVPVNVKIQVHKELEILDQQTEQLDSFTNKINAIQQLRITSGLRTVELIIESTQKKNLLQRFTNQLQTLAENKKQAHLKDQTKETSHAESAPLVVLAALETSHKLLQSVLGIKYLI